MKKQLYCGVLTILTLMVSNTANAQTTIPLLIGTPATTGLCQDNLFSATFIANGQHFFTIQAELFRDTVIDAVYYCADPVVKPKLLIVFDSANTSLISQTTDTSAGTWTGEINSTDTITIWYHVYLDCSSVNYPNSSTTNLNLVQTFTDSLNYFYDTGSGNNTHASNNLSDLRFISFNNPTFGSSYMDSTYLTFYYINTGDGIGDIRFSFTSDTSNYCGMLNYDSLEYAVGTIGSFQPLLAMTPTSVFVLSGDTIVVRQRVVIDTCISSCANAKVFFHWQCAQPPSVDSIFCNTCTVPIQTNFTINNNNNALLQIERITPAFSEAEYDNSCLNDTVGMVDWHFRITNSGAGAIDSVWINLFSSDIPEVLSLVPQSSLSMQATCNSCVDSVLVVPRTNYLCQNFIPDALDSAWMRLKNFRVTDTVDVYFQTFRCASDDPILFSEPKTMNNWRLQVYGKDVCTAIADTNLVGIPFFGSSNIYAISGHSYNGSNDLTLNHVFTPVDADLTVPKDSTFGQSTTLEIEFKGGINGKDLQILGCLTDTCSQINGYLKAVISCEKGLIVMHPDSLVRIKMLNQNTNSYQFLNPVYQHTLTPANSCVAGDYSYYFDLSNPLFKNVLDSGVFEFSLQSCCYPSINPVDYQVSFSLLPDPDTCYSLSFPPGDSLPPVCSGSGCVWIPLKKVENIINVLCPGCKTPGMIVDNYLLRRTSFGLQDSDNDGLADSGAVMVTPGSVWFDSHNIKTHHSTVGDELEDLLISHFQEGDPTNNGYSYAQMLQLDSRLEYLQLMREIPMGIDTMQLTPVEFTFYVDSTDLVNYDCIDCEFFGVDTMRYRTMLKVHVKNTDSLFSSFIELFPANNRMLFTFESLFDSVNSHSGNLHDYDSLIIHADTLRPFNGFFEKQQYRLHVTYRQCGTLVTSQGDLVSLEDIASRSLIRNVMWLSGAKQNHDAYPLLEAPKDTAALHASGWTFIADTLTLVDSSFSHQYVFYCEGYSKFHYFFFQNIGFLAGVSNDTSCMKKLNFTATIRTRANAIKAFPYEYRPTPLWPNHIQVTVPTGYMISSAKVKSNLDLGSFGINTIPYTFTTPTTGVITLQDSSWMHPATFHENNFPWNPSDSLLFVMSERSSVVYEMLLSPDSCIKQPQAYADSSVVFNFSLTHIPFLPFDSTFCTSGPLAEKASAAQFSEVLVTLPNLTGSFNPFTTEANSQRICFDSLIITNLSIPLDSPSTVFSSGAANVFLSLPDSANYPFLSNWIYFSYSGDTILPSGQIIPLDTWLPPNGQIIGKVCATYNPCQDFIQVPFEIGWDCDGFPSSPFDPDSVCQTATVNTLLMDHDVLMTSTGKQHPHLYYLCQPFEISTNYNNGEPGGFVPQFIAFNDLPAGLIPLYALIQSCDTLYTDTLDAINNLTWVITTDNLISVGITDSALNELECARVIIGLLPECEFKETDYLPGLRLYGETFCGDTLSVFAGFNGTFELSTDTSFCDDCFSIEKSALQPSAFPGDTVTFRIITCGYNAMTQNISFSDQLPLYFTAISAIPDSVTVPAIGCDTTFITGFYTQAGSCGLPVMQNTATIYFGGDSLSSSACLPVYAPCAATADTIVADSTFTSTMPAYVDSLTIFLAGRLYVDDAITFNNCTIFVNTGGQIILQPGGSIILDSTMIQGCDHMWQGIMTDTLTSVAITNGSIIRDANRAVEARDGSDLKITHSSFEDNVWGIYVPANANGNNITHTIYGNRFGMFGSMLKPAYPGQAPFGSVPYAGIEVNDVVMMIGSTEADSNWFYNMNTGVLGHRSALKVVNNKFSLIQIDTALSNPSVWDGTAIASLGDHDSSIVGKLIVRPVNSGAWTIENCRQGVYTDFSDLDIFNVKMTRMKNGIFSTRCLSPMQSVAKGCLIEADFIGIDWQLNNGSTSMVAESNSIYMTGAYTYGILMQELNTTATANYLISGNYIEMNDGMFGITGMNLFRSAVVSNIVKLSGSTSPVASGIAYKGGLNNVIQCNIVDGDNATDTTRAGIVVNISESTQVLCNRTDETGFGVFFGGINPATSFRGNTMIDHFNGLRLNSVAVIDTQSHAGNRWIGSYTDTLGNWGAVNMNADSAQALAFSLFEVNPTPDAALLPSTPGTTAPPVWPNDNGWFLVLTNGDPFACDSIYSCHFDHEEEKSSSEELKMAIAADSTITVDFIPESKAVAKQYLYDELKRDTALVSGNNLFNGFVNYNNSKAIGHLYETRQEFQEAFSLDSTLQNSLINTYSLLNQLIDSVFVLDSLNILNPGSYAVYRQSLIQTITSTNINITSLLDQYQIYRSGKLSTVLQKNTLVIPDEIPESHEKTINEVEVIYQTGGKDAIMGYQSIIQSIANQCPYKGGKAVYRARALASFFNNQIFYDDQAECALQGIYRSTQASIKTKQKITLIPNPANESVSIITSGFGEGLCKLQIQNSVNQITGSYIFNCSDKNYRVNTSRLSPGIYTVHITIDNKNYTLEKLVIIR